MLISPTVPFPSIDWWIKAVQSKSVCFDIAEHYQKMSYRNRYYLVSPQGKQLMSIPLQNGRNQRKAVKDVYIDNTVNWQEQHWRTLVSLYRRSPFFEYYEHYIQPLYDQPATSLHQWNKQGIDLINQLLKLKLNFSEASTFQKEYADDFVDMRNNFLPKNKIELPEARYYQVFEDRVGFIENCSILDLLFCEGPVATNLLLRY